jgi:hypothetical protein
VSSAGVLQEPLQANGRPVSALSQAPAGSLWDASAEETNRSKKSKRALRLLVIRGALAAHDRRYYE